MKDPMTGILRYHDFPELSRAVDQCTGTILERWEAAVQQILPEANALSRTELRDSLPATLKSIGEALASNSPGPMRNLLSDAFEHGQCRFNQDYNLNDVLVEYSILRSIAIEEVGTHLHRALTSDEVIAMNIGIDLAVRRSVVCYVREQIQKLQASAEAQSKYLSFLSHDVRGGLNGVLLMGEVLRRELITEPRLSSSLEDLEMMKRAILDTVATIDRFLHAERFRKGKVKLTPATLNIAATVGDIVGQMGYTAKEKGLTLQLTAPGECTLRTDKELAVLILQNLISNALKYTPRGKVQVVVEAAAEKSCRISVIDQGPGIEVGRIPTLFAPYTRGETHGQPGVGLGLSIAKQATDLLRGNLDVKSTLGHGATFILTLPNLPDSV